MRKVIGSITEFPMLKHYRQFCMGEITAEEYAECNNDPVIQPIYEDEIIELEELTFQKKYLEKLLNTVQSKISSIEYAIRKKIMDSCKHELSYDGHGHNSDHYKCHKCGYTEWQ